MSSYCGLDKMDEDIANISQDSDMDKLQKQLRILGNTRRVTMEEIRNIVRKQVAEYDQLKNDNEEVKLLLQLVQSERYEKADSKIHKNLYQLADTYDNIQRKLLETKKIITQLDKAINSFQKSAGLKRQISEVDLKLKKQESLEKRANVTEDRLQRQMAYFHKQLSHNIKLRKEIDNIRQERKTYEQIYSRMFNELNSIRKDRNAMLSDATHFYKESAAVAVFGASALDTDAFDAAVVFVIDADVAVKSMYRQLLDEVKDFATAGQQLEIYDKALRRIEEITGLTDTESIISNFKANEEENFSLFKYINEQNTEHENLTESIRELRQNISELEEISENLQTKQEDKILSVKDKISKSSQHCDKQRHSLTERRKVFEEFYHGMESLYNILQCPSFTSFRRDSLPNDSKTDEKAIQHLMNGIDQKVSKLIFINQYLETLSGDDLNSQECISGR
ncbi:coiled-coil domain-containing protein 63 [Octopus bimaculoides]|uniref:coiled-coil domain-containing protein 63 n=1 Tax=Octopus bimaculoides TaxID=37653 RepID=UPI00071E4A4C|nr:coiled-coil domain-containing protein 63 [Octopus bimaculoides]|eukprot:XP_014784993.1 PREDICTED: coiled-coil domain-containing protein 63-like [Octopus bimaculoides]